MITRSANNVVYVDNAMDEMEVLEQIVEQKQYATIKRHGERRGQLIDLFSAQVVMKVWNFIKEDEVKRQKFLSLPLYSRVKLSYKCLT